MLKSPMAAVPQRDQKSYKVQMQACTNWNVIIIKLSKSIIWLWAAHFLDIRYPPSSLLKYVEVRDNAKLHKLFGCGSETTLN